ncbi:MAG: CopG family transcriptional regulator [Bauldia sp.]|nr:CopG family transcriptional regulator [Bauldia sp.]
MAGAVDASDWQAAAVLEGLASIERGEVISHEAVKAWLASWGTADELPPPKVGQ